MSGVLNKENCKEICKCITKISLLLFFMKYYNVVTKNINKTSNSMPKLRAIVPKLAILPQGQGLLILFFLKKRNFYFLIKFLSSYILKP